MADAPVRLGPLAALALAKRPSVKGGRVRLSEPAFSGKLNLRVDGEGARLAGEALGLALPAACTSASSAELTALWLGPDEFLIVVPPARTGEIETTLRAALAGVHHAVTDVSDRMTTIRVAGPKARETLAAGCPLDLHPSVVAPGYVAGTHVAKATVVVHLAGGDAAAPVFDLYLNRSFAEYLWLYLEVAGREFGCEIAA